MAAGIKLLQVKLPSVDADWLKAQADALGFPVTHYLKLWIRQARNGEATPYRVPQLGVPVAASSQAIVQHAEQVAEESFEQIEDEPDPEEILQRAASRVDLAPVAPAPGAPAIQRIGQGGQRGGNPFLSSGRFRP